MNKLGRGLLAAALIGGCLSAAYGAGQGEAAKADPKWPTKPIQIVVPFKPGGDTDFNARVYAKYLEKELGQPVVIVNVDGNGGTLGSRKVKDAAPDGYTALFYHAAVLINEVSGVAEYGFDALDMACVAAMNPGDVFVVTKDSKYKTLKDLVEDSKANPGKIRFAGNTGATTYLEGLLLNAAGAAVNIVDAGGSADRIAALRGGHVDVIPNPYGTVKAYLNSGDFRALALVREQRNSRFPNIPTAVEQGYDVVVPIPYFFAFPKGTPKEYQAKLSAAVEKIAKGSQEYAAEIAKAYDQTPFFLPSEEAVKLFTGEREKVMKHKDKMKVQ
jgi:tripartite-type tricarboxylate transporter receptor subunit TctC